MKPRTRPSARPVARPLSAAELAHVIGGAPAPSLKQHVDNPGQTP